MFKFGWPYTRAGSGSWYISSVLQTCVYLFWMYVMYASHVSILKNTISIWSYIYYTNSRQKECNTCWLFWAPSSMDMCVSSLRRAKGAGDIFLVSCMSGWSRRCASPRMCPDWVRSPLQRGTIASNWLKQLPVRITSKKIPSTSLQIIIMANKWLNLK